MRRTDQKEQLKSILVGERIRRELTQEQVAEAIGVSPRNYQRWEQGKTFPQPYYLKRLQEFFGPCIDEIFIPIGSGNRSNNHSESPDASDRPPEKISYKPHWPFSFLRDRRYHRPALVVCLAILVLAISTGFMLHLTHPYGFGPVKPGGVWVSPAGLTVGDIVLFEAYAYPTHPSDPVIDHVNFTAYWPGVDPRAWKIICQERVPIRKDVYACDANLKQLGAVPGQITISFDVYDVQGNVSFAPNGEHTITYLPGFTFTPRTACDVLEPGGKLTKARYEKSFSCQHVILLGVKRYIERAST